MKKFILLFSLTILCLACSEEGINTSDSVAMGSEDNNLKMRTGSPCPEGTTGSLSYEFDTMRLHRASRNCERGFGICSDGFWTIDCEDEDGMLIAQAPLGLSNGKTQGKAFIHPTEKTLNLYFPGELTSDENFTAEDFLSFGVEKDWEISKDIIVKEGDYTLDYTPNGLIKIVLEIY